MLEVEGSRRVVGAFGRAGALQGREAPKTEMTPVSSPPTDTSSSSPLKHEDQSALSVGGWGVSVQFMSYQERNQEMWKRQKLWHARKTCQNEKPIESKVTESTE